MPEMITVKGMSCEHCEQTVEDALQSVDGVTAAAVDRETETATVEGDADIALLVRAIEGSGYAASA